MKIASKWWTLAHDKFVTMLRGIELLSASNIILKTMLGIIAAQDKSRSTTCHDMLKSRKSWWVYVFK